MAQDLEDLRTDISKLDSLAGELRDNIYDIEERDECWEIIDALDNLQEEITNLQSRQNWI